MRTTTRWGWTVPSLGTDSDDIPTQVGALADAIDSLVAKFSSGAWPLPAATTQTDWYHFVTNGTNVGTLWRYNGSAWGQVSYRAGAGGVTSASFGDAAAIGTEANGWAPIDHRHGMMVNPITAHVAATDPHPQYAMDSDIPSASFNRMNIAFHIAAGLTTGLKIPKFIVTQACTITSARGILNAGSGVKFQVFVNGVAPTGMTDSPSVGTAMTLHDFTDINLNVGDLVQIDVTNAGSAASDLSVTIDGLWR